MLQIPFAVIFFESECTLCLHGQEYPLFLPLGFVLRDSRLQPQGRAAAPTSLSQPGSEAVWSTGAQGCGAAGRPGLWRMELNNAGKHLGVLKCFKGVSRGTCQRFPQLGACCA